MKNTVIAGVILMAVGVLSLGYYGVNYTSREKIIDAGPIQVSADTQKTVSIPPAIGAVLLAVGAVLVFSNRKSN